MRKLDYTKWTTDYNQLAPSQRVNNSGCGELVVSKIDESYQHSSKIDRDLLFWDLIEDNYVTDEGTISNLSANKKDQVGYH